MFRLSSNLVVFRLFLSLASLFFLGSAALSGSAALQGNIDITYDVSDMPNTIRPESDVVRIPVDVYYFVSGLMADWIVPLFERQTVPIALSVENVPEYVTVKVAPDVVYPRVSIDKSETPERLSLSVSVNPDAPAFQTVSFILYLTLT